MEEGSEMLLLNKSYSQNYVNNNEGSYSKVIVPYVSHKTPSVDWVNKSFTKLDINCNATKIESDVITDDKCLAGNIQSIVSTMGLVLIQPLLPTLLYLNTPLLPTLLYLNTPLFLYDPINQIQNSSTHYIYLGKIDDIFGSVNEPIYSVNSILEKINVLNIGDQVYFLPNNPDTQFMSVEHTLNNSFKIIKKKNK